jgi:hypothetical protein
MSNIVSMSSIKDARIECDRRLGAAMNHVALAITDMKKFSDIRGMEKAIETLHTLHHQLYTQLESTPVSGTKETT